MDTIRYLENNGFSLKKVGTDTWEIAECPFCGHKDCFRAKADFFKCFSCQAGGDAAKFESLKNNISYGQAKAKLSGATIVPLNPMNDLSRQNHEYLFSHPEHLKWLVDERKIAPEILKKFRIGCFQDDNGRIHYSFPYFNGYSVANYKNSTADKQIIYIK